MGPRPLQCSIRAASAACILSIAFARQILLDDLEGGLKWVHSKDAKYSGEFVVGKGTVEVLPEDHGLIIPENARHYAASQAVDLDPSKEKEFVVQYEVKYENGVTCSGSYLKLLMAPFDDLEGLKDGVPYSIMFGPDKCGANDRVHFIFQYKNRVTGDMVEHHLQRPPPIGGVGKKTHLYTLVVRGEEFEIKVDGEVKRSGSISDADDFSPPLNPPEEVDDPDDKKPLDWVDEQRIPDPTAKKPEKWDETQPKMIPDASAKMPEGWLEDEPQKVPNPDAKKPDEWDDEEDGEWIPESIDNPKCSVGCGPWIRPMVGNPEYRGKWTAPLIDNPNYIGEWKPRRIKNPAHYKVDNPCLLPVAALGLELWVMDSNIRFDNFYVGTSAKEAEEFAKNTWKKKQEIEVKSEPIDEDLAKKAKKGKQTAFERYLTSLDGLVESGLRTVKLHAAADVLANIMMPHIFSAAALGTGGLLLFVLALVSAFTRKQVSSPSRAQVQAQPQAAVVVRPGESLDERKKTDAEITDSDNPEERQVEVTETSASTSAGGLRQRKPLSES
eukprot:Plantae.Rhodophyta-Purpureofilum_apyrenoidigerum.ctg11484.p1 GENE.Plantae.Rhodophyta-Purpureofilum_apyrenoidigerum.ctg11484~~Plantae.Rhodophyta-Purpureofilum_apyrenoidigerum.ctg11484.p1  ORF type:complete len:554 (-),score=107.02 Plantae.Rhodophyta-Purpureofilum_apyrenoidigerum.ctg11484:316-1977(-)